MNILQLAKYYPPIYGGIELVEKMMTKSHRENGDEVMICAFSNKPLLETGEFGEVILRIKENMSLLNASFNLNFVGQFKKIIIKYNIQKIYVHLPNPFMHEIVSRYQHFLKHHNVEVVGIYHSDIVNKSWLGVIYNWHFFRSSACYKSLIVGSVELWKSSPILSKINLTKQKVLPFCIEEINVNLKEKKIFKNKLVSVGRLVPYKGFEFLIKTFNETEYELNIVGNGPLLKKLKKMANKNIIFYTDLGNQEKNNLISECDLMIVGSLSRAEAYGLSIVEAFAHSIPVIAPQLNTGVNYLVQNEITGLIYQVKNAEDLLNKVEVLKNCPNRYNEFSYNCKKFYDDYLTYEKFKKGLLEK